MNDWHIYLYSFGMVMMVTLISGLFRHLSVEFQSYRNVEGKFCKKQTRSLAEKRNSDLAINHFFILYYRRVDCESAGKYMMNKDLGYNGNRL
jgi:putative ABC transport system permease protein